MNALWKYRNAGDRIMHYGYGMGQFGMTCYIFIFTPKDLQRSGFINAISGAQLELLEENFGISLLPVTPSGCYKITLNGKGICNAVFTWIHL
jgi:hypothetical protein